MPAATATSPWTPPAANSSPPLVAAAGPAPRAPRAAPPPPPTWDDDADSDQPARAAASSSSRRLASLPTAAAVSVAAFVFGAAISLLTLALVVAASGHYGVSMGQRSTPAVLAGAGFACAYAAAVLALWRGGRLHPAAVAVVWALALVAVVSGAGAVAALLPIGGGALAICLGAADHVRRDPRPVIVLVATACMLSVAAGVLAPATHAHRPAPAAAVPAGPDPLPPAATAAPSPAESAPTPAASPSHGPAATTPQHAATGPAAAATPTPAASPSPATTPAPTPQHTAATPTATTPPTGATAAPATPVGPADVAAATQVVRDFYAALDAHRFTAAWAMLPAAVHARFGGFDTWRAGYGKTLSSRPQDIAVSAAPGGVLVRLTLVATDRTSCGPRTARFAVRWELVRRRTSWGAASLDGTPLGSPGRDCG